MRHRYIGGAVLAAVVAIGWPGEVAAQEGGFQTPLNSDPVIPIPTGRAGEPGFYFGAEFVMLTQTRALGNQSIGVRGFFDAQGAITGVPGTFVGTGADALNTSKMGRREFQPGFKVEIGYKFDTGTRIYANYLQLYDAHYSAGASQYPLGYRARPDLADTFLSAPVYNFNQLFNGPLQDTAFDNSTNGGANTVGIWNAADIMDTKFTQRYQQAELGMRIPMFATEMSSVYGLSGARFAWFFERFTWRTVDIDSSGNSTPQSSAVYTNSLSQRMYGLFVGCGHEVYLGNMFSASLDLTAAAYMDVAKQRAKYELGDKTTQSKFGRESFDFVPSATADLNLWMYPIEGVQLKLGYTGMSFFNTRYMREPVGYNFGNIDPNYGTKVFRLIHGFNVGIGFFF
ncbi:hypothetical protein VT84_00095 [Gemmata sp. SH-PL17]|uniref:hypothetical protein n=1 Tax=Gemmata sp. SH-PL17 TaxID=1630693 RepID=UPI00078DA059|nr:hypothetical protein [Gemmata sp. SH-PL17]AMV22777.1 hypothetical protein VT84_00095 [Gemmata sp. SH-PL17]